MIQRSDKPVVVVEAIKLLESTLYKVCDSIWVVYSPPELQAGRLMQKRGMSEADARQRITTQPPQEQKMAAANVVIKNTSSFEDTWRQVAAAWQKKIPSPEASQAAAPVKSGTLPQGDVTIARGRPRDSETIATFINRYKTDGRLTTDDIMAEFGDKAFLLLRVGERLIGVAGWQVENLVARTSEIVIDPLMPADKILPLLVTEMERSSRDLQCEASLVFTPKDLSFDAVWKGLGYERRTPQSLGVSAWQEAAVETLKPGAVLYFKQLRQDRVLRPI
jgi:dephospho-CoA kinase